MPEPQQTPPMQTFNLELPVLRELRLREEPPPHPKPEKPLEDQVNEDLIRRLINRLKKM